MVYKSTHVRNFNINFGSKKDTTKKDKTEKKFETQNYPNPKFLTSGSIYIPKCIELSNFQNLFDPRPISHIQQTQWSDENNNE